MELTKPNSSHCSPVPSAVVTDGCHERWGVAGNTQEGSTRLLGAVCMQPAYGLCSSPVQPRGWPPAPVTRLGRGQGARADAIGFDSFLSYGQRVMWVGRSPLAALQELCSDQSKNITTLHFFCFYESGGADAQASGGAPKPQRSGTWWTQCVQVNTALHTHHYLPPAQVNCIRRRQIATAHPLGCLCPKTLLAKSCPWQPPACLPAASLHPCPPSTYSS